MDNIFVERLWRSLKYEEVVCCERLTVGMRSERSFIEDEGGPSESACRSRLQTATSCEGKEPSW